MPIHAPLLFPFVGFGTENDPTTVAIKPQFASIDADGPPAVPWILRAESVREIQNVGQNWVTMADDVKDDSWPKDITKDPIFRDYMTVLAMHKLMEQHIKTSTPLKRKSPITRALLSIIPCFPTARPSAGKGFRTGLPSTDEIFGEDRDNLDFAIGLDANLSGYKSDKEEEMIRLSARLTVYQAVMRLIRSPADLAMVLALGHAATVGHYERTNLIPRLGQSELSISPDRKLGQLPAEKKYIFRSCASFLELYFRAQIFCSQTPAGLDCFSIDDFNRTDRWQSILAVVNEFVFQNGYLPDRMHQVHIMIDLAARIEWYLRGDGNTQLARCGLTFDEEIHRLIAGDDRSASELACVVATMGSIFGLQETTVYEME